MCAQSCSLKRTRYSTLNPLTHDSPYTGVHDLPMSGGTELAAALRSTRSCSPEDSQTSRISDRARRDRIRNWQIETAFNARIRPMVRHTEELSLVD